MGVAEEVVVGVAFSGARALRYEVLVSLRHHFTFASVVKQVNDPRCFNVACYTGQAPNG